MNKVILILFVISIFGSIDALPLINISDGSDFFEVNQGQIFLYNFSVNNTDMFGLFNVSISVPSSFKFVNGSFGTSATYTLLENSSSVIRWSGEDIVGLNEIEFFWFKANSTSEGDLSISVLVQNSSYNSIVDFSVSVFAEDGDCTPNWNCSNWTACKNNIQTRNCVDLNNCGEDPSQKLTLQICDSSCVPNWTCTNWSECQDGIQARSCVDKKLCNNETGKPLEFQECGLSCVPDWSCTDWEPSTCLSDGVQNRECIDDNNCGVEPIKTRACDYNPQYQGLFWFLVVIIMLLIGLVIFLMIKKIKELNKK